MPTNNNPTLLSINGLTKRFGASAPLFNNVSFELARGEWVAVLGESGCGKSTLLNCIAGLEHGESGTITVDGIAVTGRSEDELARLRRSKLGFVFQSFHLLPYLDVAGNVSLPLHLNAVAPSVRTERTRQLIEAVGLANRAHAKPRELSGGEMQRVAIARALVHRPLLLLADEPTGNLDPRNAQIVLDLFANVVRKEQTACVMVTHSEIAARKADRVFRMADGGLVAG